MEHVLVQYDFEYTAKDGRLISIKPNERYTLLSKTNEHWWHVRKDQDTRPFYVPAQYVKEVSSLMEDSPPNKLNSPETDSKPEAVSTKTPAKTFIHDGSREKCRFSTFGFYDEIPELKLYETPKKAQNHSTADAPNDMKPCNTSASLHADVLQLYAKPHPVLRAKNRKKLAEISLQEDKIQQTRSTKQEEEIDLPSPPSSPIYDTIPEINISQFDTFSDLPAPLFLDDTLTLEEQDLSQTAEATSTTDALPAEKVGFFFKTMMLSMKLKCVIITFNQERAPFYHVRNR